jgi:predicted nucleic acid-binding protein
MQRVISNSSPIIHLAKIAQLDLLKEYFGTLIVPKGVYNECVTDGKETSLRNREANQPIIYVYVKKWRKHSLIEEVKLAEVA